MAQVTQTLVLQGESELVRGRLRQDCCGDGQGGHRGSAGPELAQGKEYAFAGAKVAIYTWFGARVEVVGETTSCYATGRGETQHATLNAHSYLETRRDDGRKISESTRRVLQGVRTGLGIAKGETPMPAGEHLRSVRRVLSTPKPAHLRQGDAGLEYCLRPDGFRQVDALRDAVRICSAGGEPVFVDLTGSRDCGAPPGAIAACRVDRDRATVRRVRWVGLMMPAGFGWKYGAARKLGVVRSCG